MTSDPRTDADGDAEAQNLLADAVAGEGADDATAAGRDSGGGEAARYRRKLRAAEAERDGLRTRLEAAQRREVERLAGSHLARGDDLWLSDDVDLPGLLDDDGNVDPGKVAEAAAAVVSTRPHWSNRTPTADPDQGRRSEQQQVEPSFADFIRGAAGGADVESWPRSRARRAGERTRDDDGTPAGERTRDDDGTPADEA